MELLVVCGGIGAGKTTIARESQTLLIEANSPHLAVDMDWLCSYWPWVAGDPYNRRTGRDALRVMMQEARRRDIQRVVLAEVVESRADVDAYREAVAADRVMVVRLVTPRHLLGPRLAARGGDVERELRRADELDEIMRLASIDDFVVANDERPPLEVAREVVELTGWLNSEPRR